MFIFLYARYIQLVQCVCSYFVGESSTDPWGAQGLPTASDMVSSNNAWGSASQPSRSSPFDSNFSAGAPVTNGNSINPLEDDFDMLSGRSSAASPQRNCKELEGFDPLGGINNKIFVSVKLLV